MLASRFNTTAATSMSHDGMGHDDEKMEAVDARNTVKLALEPAAALSENHASNRKAECRYRRKPRHSMISKEAHAKKLGAGD